MQAGYNFHLYHVRFDYPPETLIALRHMAICSLCTARALARGLCRNHYYQARRHGTLAEHAKTRPPLEIRFLARVQKTPTCWLWTGGVNADGYGIVWLDATRQALAHRVSYALHYGINPRAQCVCHHCDNPSCVRPDHLFVGDQKANTQDAWQM